MGLWKSLLVAAVVATVLILIPNNAAVRWILGEGGDLLIALLGGLSLVAVAAESTRIEPRNRLRYDETKLESAKQDLSHFLLSYTKQLPAIEFERKKPWAEWANLVEDVARSKHDEPEQILKAIESPKRQKFTYENVHEEKYVKEFVDFADHFARQYCEAASAAAKTKKQIEPNDLEVGFVFLAPLFLAIATAIGVAKALT